MTSIESGLGVGNTGLSWRCTVVFTCRYPLRHVATSPNRKGRRLAQQLTKPRLSDEARAAAAKAEDEQKVLEIDGSRSIAPS